MVQLWGSCFLLSRIWLSLLTRPCLCSTAVLFTQSPLPTSTSSVSSPLSQPSASTYMRSVLLCVKTRACVVPAVQGPFLNKLFLHCSSGNWVQTERIPLPFAWGCFHWESQVCICEIPFSPIFYLIWILMLYQLFYFYSCYYHVKLNRCCLQATLFTGEGGRGCSLPSVQNHGGSRRERIQHRETGYSLYSSAHWLGQQTGRR